MKISNILGKAKSVFGKKAPKMKLPTTAGNPIDPARLKRAQSQIKRGMYSPEGKVKADAYAAKVKQQMKPSRQEDLSGYLTTRRKSPDGSISSIDNQATTPNRIYPGRR